MKKYIYEVRTADDKEGKEFLNNAFNDLKDIDAAWKDGEITQEERVEVYQYYYAAVRRAFQCPNNVISLAKCCSEEGSVEVVIELFPHKVETGVSYMKGHDEIGTYIEV